MGLIQGFIKILVGSANFTNVGLTSQNREILVEAESKDYGEILEYVDDVIFNSTSSVNMDDLNLKLRSSKSQSGSPKLDLDESLVSSKNRVCILSLLDKNDLMPNASGLNWGQSEKAKVKPNDAYISIRVSNIKAFPEIFPEKAMISENPLGKKNRQNDPVDVIFDDNTIMSCLLEGSQEIDGQIYPNKLSSFPKKNELGKYFRNRLEIGAGEKITKQDLVDYGRTDISIQKIGQDQYYIDFSKDEFGILLEVPECISSLDNDSLPPEYAFNKLLDKVKSKKTLVVNKDILTSELRYDEC